MRIRQVKPEFFKDGTIAGLSPVARLTYIGLWMLADDAGWLRLDVPAIGIELFGYEPRKRREHVLATVLDDLERAERIIRHDCGHALIPTLVDHQRFGGETRRVYTIQREHGGCSRVPADPRESPRVPAPVRNGRGTGNGMERKGTETPARAPSGAAGDVWEERVAATLSRRVS